MPIQSTVEQMSVNETTRQQKTPATEAQNVRTSLSKKEMRSIDEELKEKNGPEEE